LIIILFFLSCIGANVLWAVGSNWLQIDQVAPELAPSSPFTQAMLELTPTSIQNAAEISTIQSSGTPDEIVALYQAMDNLDLLVVHESGLFHRWDLETKSLEAEYDFLAGRRTGVNFNFDGSQVITPGKLVSGDSLYGYSLWDVNTGEMLDCKGDHCFNPIPFEQSSAESGLALSPNGDWIVDYGGAFVSGDTRHRNMNLGGVIYVDTDSFDMKYFTIDQIAFDISGVYLAVAIEEGILKVYDIDDQFLPRGESKPLDEYEYDYRDTDTERKFARQYGRYDDENPMYTSDLAIDDTRTWLARLTDEELIIYDLRKRFFPRHLKVPISNGNLLAFNHSGNLLTVATDEELIMFDLAKRKQVASFNTGEATAIFFTHDDRLLTWGDENGVIHIWGVEGSEE